MGTDTSKIAVEANMTPAEVAWLRDRYEVLRQHADGSRRDHVELTAAQFCGKFPTTQQTLAKMLFDAMDHDRKGVIDFRQFVLGVSVLRDGSRDSKVDFAFRLYDSDSKGFITFDDLLKAVEAFPSSTRRLLMQLGEGPDEAYMSPLGGEPPSNTELYIDPRHAAAAIFKRMDTQQTGRITQDEFKTFCVNNTHVLDQVHLAFMALRRAAMFDWAMPT